MRFLHSTREIERRHRLHHIVLSLSLSSLLRIVIEAKEHRHSLIPSSTRHPYKIVLVIDRAIEKECQSPPRPSPSGYAVTRVQESSQRLLMTWVFRCDIMAY